MVFSTTANILFTDISPFSRSIIYDCGDKMGNFVMEKRCGQIWLPKSVDLSLEESILLIDAVGYAIFMTWNPTPKGTISEWLQDRLKNCVYGSYYLERLTPVLDKLTFPAKDIKWEIIGNFDMRVPLAIVGAYGLYNMFIENKM